MTELNLGREHVSHLLFHLGIMRNGVKKSLYRNLGRKEGKEKLKIYDEIIDIVENAHVEEKEYICLNGVQEEMLHSFLYFYLDALKQQGEREKAGFQNSIVYSSLSHIFSIIKENRYAQVQG